MQLPRLNHAQRENLLRRMPWHLCIKINPAIRLISSSCARPYLGRLYILSEHIITLDGTFPAIQGWSHPSAECRVQSCCRVHCSWTTHFKSLPPPIFFLSLVAT